jgi:hypothetical protein
MTRSTKTRKLAKTERIVARVTPEQKQILQHTALLQGISFRGDKRAECGRSYYARAQRYQADGKG